MRNSNCGNCPHIHRCYATNDNECIDTIVGKKHYVSEHDKQIRTDAIDEFDRICEEARSHNFGVCDADFVIDVIKAKVKEQLKEQKNE